MKLETNSNPENRGPQWKITLINERAGYKLEDEKGNFLGAVAQDILNRGEWWFSNNNYPNGKGGFKSSEEAKEACKADLNL